MLIIIVIYYYYFEGIEKVAKDSLMIVWQENEWTHALLTHASVYIVDHVTRFSLDGFLVYNIGVQETDVMEPLLMGNFNFLPTEK